MSHNIVRLRREIVIFRRLRIIHHQSSVDTMSYVIAIPIILPFSRDVVFESLTNLAQHPEWNTGMISISSRETMREGMRYRTSIRICGIVNTATVAVESLVSNEIIELVSKSGLISFRALYKLVECGPEETELICTLRFGFRGFIFNAARQVIESMAGTRCRRDLVALRDIIERDVRKTPAMNGNQSSRQQ